VSVITLRPATEHDEGFLRAVYASTREFELAQTDWSDEQKAYFCLQQAQAQSAHYRQHYPTAQYFVIERGDQSAGRLYVDHWEKEIRIMDIALLPEFRGLGIGAQLLRQLQSEAQQSSKILSIHVETFNPARRLYERLGFQVAEDKGVYVLMSWTPDAAIK
jgi:ribosomal protein S18 acetylase RimI-like enzyme